MDIRKYNILQNYNFVTRTIKSVVIQFIAIVTGAAKISLSIDTSVLTVSIVNQALINVWIDVLDIIIRIQQSLPYIQELSLSKLTSTIVFIS